MNNRVVVLLGVAKSRTLYKFYLFICVEKTDLFDPCKRLAIDIFKESAKRPVRVPSLLTVLTWRPGHYARF